MPLSSKPLNQASMSASQARRIALAILLIGILLGIFDAPQFWNRGISWASRKLHAPALVNLSISAPLLRPYRQGLDIQGGTHLVYKADVSSIANAEYANSLDAVRDVIERRVNLFGVSEPLVQVEKSGSEWRLIVELAGIKDVNAAIRLIGLTPFLEFKEERAAADREAILADQKSHGPRAGEDANFKSTGLTGRFVKSAQVNFDRTTFQPTINLELTDEGAKLFGELTKRNIGKQIAIYLDGAPISAPVVREEITGGRAQISGSFTPESAKELAGRLNAGALPVPITLISQQSVGASLGEASLARSLYAGMIGFLLVALFMILWYRFPGIIAIAALGVYMSIVLAIFKLVPVTLTIAGIAGFILSIGMAVDANILIFERMKEELRAGRALNEAIYEGFRRAWTSIRDSNISSLITSAILYWLGTSVVRGFALTLSIGILASMFSAVTVTRTFLFAMKTGRMERMRSLFMSGFSK